MASLFFPHDPGRTPYCGRRHAEPVLRDDPEVESLRMTEDRGSSRLKKAHNEELVDMVGSRMTMHVTEFGSVLLSNSAVWTVEEITPDTVR